MAQRTRASAVAFPWLRVSLFVSLWLALFTYAGRPFLIALHATGVAPAIAWTLLGALALLPLLPYVSRFSGERQSNAAHLVGHMTLALFSTLFVLVIAGDVARFTAALLRTALATVPVPRFAPALTSFAMLGAAVLLTGIGAAQARCPKTRRVSIEVEGLPQELVGYRIVQWSDVHVGPSIRRPFLDALVRRTNELQPDAVVITGDFIDAEFAQFRDDLAPVADLATKDGVYYVTGNHEYYRNAPAWLPELSALGITFLKNEHHTIARGTARLAFAGVTDPVGRGTHRQDMAAALDGVPHDATTILLSHRPQMAEEADQRGVAVQLSGHTHGGQFFPFNLMVGWFQPIVSGLHRVGRTWLYVSRGTGYWGPPSRLGVGGEVTVIELQKES